MFQVRNKFVVAIDGNLSSGHLNDYDTAHECRTLTYMEKVVRRAHTAPQNIRLMIASIMQSSKGADPSSEETSRVIETVFQEGNCRTLVENYSEGLEMGVLIPLYLTGGMTYEMSMMVPGGKVPFVWKNSELYAKNFGDVSEEQVKFAQTPLINFYNAIVSVPGFSESLFIDSFRIPFHSLVNMTTDLLNANSLEPHTRRCIVDIIKNLAMCIDVVQRECGQQFGTASELMRNLCLFVNRTADYVQANGHFPPSPAYSSGFQNQVSLNSKYQLLYFS